VANILIQLNQEFITEDKLYRLVGKEVDFKEFKKDDKKVVVDAIVEVEPVIPPDKTTRLNQVLLMYDKFIAQDKPDPNNPEEVTRWLKRKRELQKMILEELDKEEYIDVLLGPEAEAKALPQTNNTQAPVTPAEGQTPPTGPTTASPNKIQQLMGKIPILGKMLGG
jgi:FKBP-type peptidyl-prolyl cis-trans isomerase (trigger factor)